MARIDALIYQQLFLEKRDKYHDCITDGSRDGNYVACTTISLSDTLISMGLPNSASLFTA